MPDEVDDLVEFVVLATGDSDQWVDFPLQREPRAIYGAILAHPLMAHAKAELI
jgi:hypothetical protein